MSDLAYKLVWHACHPAIWVSSRPTVLHRDRVEKLGAHILAPNHLSPFDVPCLMAAAAPRNVDFVSIVEAFRNPLVALLYGSVNVFPLDRSRPDGPTVRVILDRLRRGRVVAMFPEGHIRTEADSVLNGAPFKPGVARIAQLADVPVVPTVLLGTKGYARLASWAPIRGLRYGINFGEPIRARKDLDKAAAVRQVLAEMRQAYLDLRAELAAAMPPPRGAGTLPADARP